MSRARILVIDDDPLFRSLVVATLRKDYLVSVAGDGSEGYKKAMEHVPDLAIIDVQMPVCDGLSVLKSFRAHPQLRDIPVMMLTGDSTKGSVVTAIQHGISGYVVKTNFDKQDFLDKIAKIFNKQSAVTSSPAPAAPAANSLASSSAGTASAPAAPATATEKPGSKNNLQTILDTWE